MQLVRKKDCNHKILCYNERNWKKYTIFLTRKQNIGGVCMNETRYMISDTAKQVEVEAHVLRYWEEELELPIARNEMGHRYYTGENIQLFKNIKELKEQGFQLKAIKMLLPDLENQEVNSMDNIINLKDELNRRAFTEGLKADKQEDLIEMYETELENSEVAATAEDEISVVAEEGMDFSLEDVTDNKMQQFEMILGNIVRQAIHDNNKELGKEIGNHVSDHVIKEIDYLMRSNEEKEEERFKRLDETIRSLQKTRRKIAAAKPEQKKKAKRWGIFKRKDSFHKTVEE
jgi:DNA-binding transcriptional MerR regulator